MRYLIQLTSALPPKCIPAHEFTYRVQAFRGTVLFLALTIALIASTQAAEFKRSVPGPNFDTSLDGIVLPGFKPLAVENNVILLGGGRQYRWGNSSILPDNLRSLGQDYVSGISVHARLNGKWHQAQANAVPEIRQNEGHDATVFTFGEISENLKISATTRVEYDGFAAIHLEISPQVRTHIERLEIRASLAAGPEVRSLQFRADTLRDRRKQFVFPASYSGPLLDALGVADGQRSFWWIAGTGVGRVAGKTPTQSLQAAKEQRVDFRDVLLQDTVVSERVEIKLNFLVTPVKDGKHWRNISVALDSAKREQGLGNVMLWWIDAFAHETLPYTYFPHGSKERLPPADVNRYHGPESSKQRIRKARGLGISILPYFSAHALSAVDPGAVEFGDEWRVVPEFVVPSSSDGPYTSDLKRPWFSHRSASYSNYLLERFSDLIDEMRFDGLYFDQGTPVQSENTQHFWVDHLGQKRAATDIIELRRFFKRLSTLFYLKGLPGYIFVHNSSSPVVPAYTFVTGMVQGEEYRIRLQEPDYLRNVDLDEIRTAFSPDQYGIGTVWLSELWSPRVHPKGYKTVREWLATREYRAAARGFLGLALIHDTIPWTYAPSDMRKDFGTIQQMLNTTGAEFIGYWRDSGYTADGPILISHYVPPGYPYVLTVVLNRSAEAQLFSVPNIAELSGCKENPPTSISAIRGSPPTLNANLIEGSAEPADYLVFRTNFSTRSDSGCSQ